jgi:diguanylate cyclase (GGDEF)-like protein/PAS domain S-box-containing protein
MNLDHSNNQIPQADFLDLLPGVYYTLDAGDIICLALSKKYFSIFGYSSEYQITGNDAFIRNVYFEDRLKLIAVWQEIQEKPMEIEYRILSAQGITILVKDIVYCPFPNKKPKIVRGYIIPKLKESSMEKSKSSFLIDFKTALDRISDLFIYLEPYYDSNNRLIDFTIKELNKAAQKKLGILQEEIIGKNFFMLLNLLKDKWGNFEDYKSCFLTQKYVELEYESTESDSIKIWHYLNLIPTPLGILLYNKEISKWKKNQNELGTTLEFLKSITHSIHGMITLHELNSQDYIFINKGVSTITGYSQWEFFAKGHELFWKMMDEEDRPRITQELQFVNRLFEDSQIEDDKKKYVTEFSIQTQAGEKKRVRNFMTLFKMNTDIHRKYVLTIGVDITQEFTTNIRLLRQEKDYKDIFSKIPNAILRFNTDFYCTFANSSVDQLLGLNSEKIIGKKIYNLGLSQALQNLFLDQMNIVRRENVDREVLFDIYLNNEYRYYKATFIPETSPSKEIKSYLLIVTDIANSASTDKVVLNAINHDSLTGLINRKFFLEKLNDLTQKLDSSKESLGILFFDINSFREVNEFLGQSVGDSILIEISKKVSLYLNEEDSLARYSGNGFALAYKSEKENYKTKIASLAIDIMSFFSDPFSIESQEIYLHVSIGISIYPEDGEDYLTLVANAEKAAFHGKRKEENTFTFFDSSMGLETARKRKIGQELRKSLEEEGFFLVYQPKVELRTGKIHGVEALLRWKSHPTLSPGVFIPVAEESGIINQIGEWVLSKSIKDISSLIQKGFSINLAVNLSPKQFAIPRISNLIFDFLSMYSFPVELFEVEVTEGTAMKNINQSGAILTDLDKKGIRISIDDFGTGYSSLAYLKKFPITQLKIDRTFIKDLPEDKNSISIVEAILSMSQNLGLKTVAEGVDSMAQWELLKMKGCDYIQGFYVSKGLTLDELEQFLIHYRSLI